MTGTVNRVFLTRGFGFVEGDDGSSYFLHVDDFVAVAEWERVRQGIRVDFTPSDSGEKANKLRARQVRLTPVAVRGNV